MSATTLNNEQQVVSQVATQYVSGNIYHISDRSPYGPCINLTSHCASTGDHESCSQEAPGRLKRKRSETDTKVLDPIFTVPYGRDRQFVSRTTLLDQIDLFDQIDRSIDRGEIVVLCGLGGAGKSQIAREYAYRFRDRCRDSHVLWVPAGNVSSITQAYQGFAHKLKLPGHNFPNANYCRLVADYLGFRDYGSGDSESGNKPWLIIIDGLDSIKTLEEPLLSPSSQKPDSIGAGLESFQDYLPYGSRSDRVFIVTTRTQDVARQLNEGDVWIDVGALTLHQSRDMMANKLGTRSRSMAEESEMDRLLQKLGQIPLAISHAAAFMNRNRVTVTKYMSKLEDEHQLAECLSQHCCSVRRTKQQVPKSVFRTWEMSYAQIEQEDPLAAKLLRLMAMLDGQQIARQLLSTWYDTNVDYDRAFGTLFSYSLISEHNQPAFVSIHNLVQISVRYWLRQRGQSEAVLSQALAIIKSSFPKKHMRGIVDLSARALMPHARSVLSHCSGKEFVNGHLRVELRLEMSVNEWNIGSLESADRLARLAYEESRKVLGDRHELTLHCLLQMGSVLVTQTYMDEAEPVLLRVLTARREVQSSKADWMIMRTLAKLGTVYRHQGRFVLAEETLREVVKASKEVNGEDSFEVWTALGHLARILNDSGKCDEAEIMHREVIANIEEMVEPEVFNTCFCLDAFGYTLRNLHKYEEAEVLQRRVVELADTIFEGKHPWKITFASNLARTLARSDQLKEALEIQIQAVEDRESIMGKNNRYYWDEVRELAYIYTALKRYEDAKDVLRRAITNTCWLSELIESYRKEAVDDLASLCTGREIPTPVAR